MGSSRNDYNTFGAMANVFHGGDALDSMPKN